MDFEIGPTGLWNLTEKIGSVQMNSAALEDSQADFKLKRSGNGFLSKTYNFQRSGYFRIRQNF